MVDYAKQMANQVPTLEQITLQFMDPDTVAWPWIAPRVLTEQNVYDLGRDESGKLVSLIADELRIDRFILQILPTKIRHRRFVRNIS
jgi:hypothetical protein